MADAPEVGPSPEQVADIGRAGRREHPAVDLPDKDLAAVLRGRTLPQPLSDERAAEIFLAGACACGVAAAVDSLQSRYLDRIAQVLSRGRNPTLVEEAVQQTAAKILVARRGRPPEIADYSGAGPLGGWLRIVALRTLIRMEKQQNRALDPGGAGGDEGGVPVPAPDNPELAYLRKKYNAALEGALADAWEAMPPDVRLLLRLRYQDNVGIDGIAGMENIHRATAARRVRKAEEMLVLHARALLRERVQASDTEIDSVMRLIRSQIHLSARRIFRP
jgi:RNA polymerase sigma-70 factor (ECF subfamily)